MVMRIVIRLERTEKHPVRITRVLQEKHRHPPISDLYFIVDLLNHFNIYDVKCHLFILQGSERDCY